MRTTNIPMSTKIINHHYTECGLPYVWIQCRVVKDDTGETVYIIPSVGKLHKLIAQAVMERPLTGVELRFLRSEMGATQAEFGKQIGRQSATIARWESGESKFSVADEARIRKVVSSKLKLGKVVVRQLDAQYAKAQWKRSTEIKIELGAMSIVAANQNLYRRAA